MINKEVQLKFEYLCIHNSLLETKKNYDHWSVVYKYVSIALNDITQQGWSTFESMLPPSDREMFYEKENEKLFVRAQHYFEQCAAKMILLETCLAELEKEQNDNIAATRELKTKTVADKVRFYEVWNTSKPYSFGEQTTLFKVAQ